MSPSSTTLQELDPAALDAEAEAKPGLALIYSRWHAALPSAFPFYNDVETLGREQQNTLSIPDDGVSRHHARFERRSDGRTWVVDLRSTNGTRVNAQRIEQHPLQEHDVLRIGHALFRYVERGIYAHSAYRIDGTVVDQVRRIEPAIERAGLVGGYQMDVLMEQAAKLARGNIGIVLRGESGTGKELVARAIHRMSARRGAFVPVNCAAIPEALVESELFGHRRGAFTGAHADRVGLVSAAHDGTLFLDEVGDMPLAAQSKLLRVLQEREVVRLGDTQPTAVDLRVVCATHRDLDQMVAQGTFRGDLYARLREVTLRLPPLRERREDLYALVLSLAHKHGRPEPAVSNQFMSALAHHGWPLNVRELESALRVAIMNSDGRALEPHHLPDSIARAEAAPARATSANVVQVRKSKPSADELRELLVRKHGNLASVARACGVHRMQLYRWMQAYQLDATQYR